MRDVGNATSDHSHRGSQPPGLKLLLWWVVANSIGATIGALLVDLLTGGVFHMNYSIGSVPADTSLKSVATGVLLGGIIGFVEWLVVRSYLAQIYWWVLATSIGWTIALSLTAFLNAHMPSYWAADGGTFTWRSSSDPGLQFIALGLLDHVVATLGKTSWIKALMLGAAIGLSQAVVLFWHVRYVQYWIVANALALAIAAFCIELIYSILDSVRYPLSTFADPLESSQIFSAFVLFLLLETGTGLTLLWLLRNRRNQPAGQSLTSEALGAN